MASRRVLHIFGAMDFGGAEMRTIELMPAMQEKDVEFHFLTLSGRRGELADRIEQAGGHVWPLPLGPRFPVAFVRFAKRHRIDVVDSHVATFSGAIVALAWLARVPVRIAHFRSDGDGQGDSRLRRAQRAVMRLLIRLFATDIVGVSPSALTDGYDARWPEDPRARVLVNGFAEHRQDSDVPPGLEGVGGAKLLTLVARPSPEKNRPKAVDILHELLTSGVDARLVLVGGQGVDSEALAARIASYGLADKVIDLGKRADAVQIMGASDLVMLTSEREGLPGVVLEALSTGTEVVSVDLPGVEFIAEYVQGLTLVDRIAPAREWVAPIRTALDRSRDPDRRRVQASTFAKSPFSLASSVEAHCRLYGVK